MPKKEKMWTMGNKGPTGPWVWHAWIKGSKKPIRVVAFDMEHIRCQLEGKTGDQGQTNQKRKKYFLLCHLGPKGSSC